MNPDTKERIYSYDPLVHGCHYFAVGSRIDALLDYQTTSAFEAADLERKAALVVQRSVGSNATIDPNVTFKIGKNDFEFDAIVFESSTAYIVETARSPQPDEVEVLLSKVAAFQSWAASSDRYKAVTKFVPVLGGRHFPAETIRRCIANKVSRVVRIPSGADFEWVCDERQ
jgi:hypothetical protein